MESNYFESKEFNEKYNYDGELGVIYSKIVVNLNYGHH